jgi:hypothetical protein
MSYFLSRITESIIVDGFDLFGGYYFIVGYTSGMQSQPKAFLSVARRFCPTLNQS